MNDKMEQFVKWVEESDNIVFFGGAGVSTESGIPDFRSVDGLYHQKYDYPPETILSHSFYMRKPEEFFRFYKNKMLFPKAEPSTTHKKLAKLEADGKLKGIVTQNIDGLHQKAGSRHVIVQSEGVPKCSCGGRIKPDVVLYEEGLDEENIEEAVRLIREADILIVGGTSLGVYPAAGLIDYYRGHKLVLINKSETPYDNRADLLIHDALGEVFSKIG